MHFKKIFFASLVMAFIPFSQSDAKPRTQKDMQAAAREVLTRRAGSAHATPAPAMRALVQNEAFTVFGSDAGFAIVAADDLLPAILAHSEGRFADDERNTGLQWWLQAMRETANYMVENELPATVVKPDPDKFPTDVAPMVTTTWGQEAPYNNMCPWGSDSGTAHWQDYGGGDGRCVTGCVATAMAQILNFHQYPEHGAGTHSVRVNGTIYTVDFSQTTYDWGHMLDDYSHGYTEEEGRAVATLMYHCGVAADMQYATDGSGTYNSNARDGLIRNFGYSADSVKLVTRSSYWGDNNNYTDSEWMEMIFNELYEERPILYTGADYNINAGHAFVFDGYNENGLVHVNWGWDGASDGYFNVSLLNPRTYSFSAQQDMLIGISGPVRANITDTLELSRPGELADLVGEEHMNSVVGLKLSGELNSSDLLTLRRMAGIDELGQTTQGHLASLDLSEARIVAGGEPYLTTDGEALTTRDDVLPAKAFYGCTRLKSVVLPLILTDIESEVFSNCPRLRSVELQQTETANYHYVDGLLLSADETELRGTLPTQHPNVEVPPQVTRIADAAFSGCRHIANLTLRTNVTKIGHRAFANSTLNTLKLYHRDAPPQVGEDAFKGITRSCVLTLPVGSYDTYLAAEGWQDFFDNGKPGNYVTEFGTRVKARNSIKKYGDPNPKLGYQITGDPVEGVPELICEADEFSPADHYPITIKPGTIDAEVIVFVDGYLIVAPAELTVSVADAQREQFADDPEFQLSYSGFRNGEDESAIETPPTVHTTAQKDSPAGSYEYYLTDGKARNYEFVYDEQGVFTVTESTALRQLLASGKPFDVYTADGILLRRQATTLQGLPKGLYLIDHKKIIVQ